MYGDGCVTPIVRDRHVRLIINRSAWFLFAVGMVVYVE